MIVREFFVTREDGVNLFRTYSNTNHTIRQVETGIVYSEAIDVEDAPYTYEETEELIETEEEIVEEESVEEVIEGDNGPDVVPDEFGEDIVPEQEETDNVEM